MRKARPSLEELERAGLAKKRLIRKRGVSTPKTAEQWEQADEAPAPFFAKPEEIPQEALRHQDVQPTSV